MNYQKISVDLHIHSALSPCGDVMMTPGNLVGMAKINGLDAIALTDHNAMHNLDAAIKIGEAYGVVVVPGMELETSEEIHDGGQKDNYCCCKHTCIDGKNGTPK